MDAKELTLRIVSLGDVRLHEEVEMRRVGVIAVGVRIVAVDRVALGVKDVERVAADGHGGDRAPTGIRGRQRAAVKAIPAHPAQYQVPAGIDAQTVGHVVSGTHCALIIGRYSKSRSLSQ